MSTDVVVKPKRAPRSLRELRAEGGVEGLLAYSLLKHHAALRDMCFIDNEHGSSRTDDVITIGDKVMARINEDLRRFGRTIRIVALTPWRDRHHHVSVLWSTTDNLFAPTEMLANLYERSKRPEDEDEERVGPRRGGDTESEEEDVTGV
jgi:hypothetical protein